ncbi:unnamed protein product [Pleuronectes platessa]|uniref:Uncharacterized protein n=1 Tax=Pleuronectes platessa TaxID=8262 RepID=A0A9N7VJ26_PLEPL|nr:unnamed protein product [Pleuronectes platessa]
MVIFPSTYTSRREGGEQRRGTQGMRGMRGEAQQIGLDLRVNAFNRVHGNDSAITHKANELSTDHLRVCTELRRRNGNSATSAFGLFGQESPPPAAYNNKPTLVTRQLDVHVNIGAIWPKRPIIYHKFAAGPLHVWLKQVCNSASPCPGLFESCNLSTPIVAPLSHASGPIGAADGSSRLSFC